MSKIIGLTMAFLFAATISFAQTASNTSSKTTSKKACCASVEKCAAKMGMTVEECKAKCEKTGSSASVSEGKSVGMTTSAGTTKNAKACTANKKTCTSKTGMSSNTNCKKSGDQANASGEGQQVKMMTTNSGVNGAKACTGSKKSCKAVCNGKK